MVKEDGQGDADYHSSAPAPTLTLSAHFNARATNHDNIIQIQGDAVSAGRTKPGTIDELPIGGVKLAKRAWNPRGPCP
jgi:hypothetical protein